MHLFMKVYCHTTEMIIDVIMKAKNEEVNYTDKNKIYIWIEWGKGRSRIKLNPKKPYSFTMIIIMRETKVQGVIIDIN